MNSAVLLKTKQLNTVVCTNNASLLTHPLELTTSFSLSMTDGRNNT